MFTGVRGVGKTTSARILAKALNCASGPTPTPCQRCSQCTEITAGSDVDVQEIDPNYVIAQLARQAWTMVVDRLEVRRWVSPARWDQIQRQLQRDALPPFTEANVFAFLEKQEDDFPTMSQEMIADLFDWLRPRHGSTAAEYKTNRHAVVGERVILTYAAERRWNNSGYRLSARDSQRMQSLENLLRRFDGQGMISKGHYSDIEAALASSPDGRAETPLFRARAFANRNLHLQFLRPDLLAKFNAAAGGLNLTR